MGYSRPPKKGDGRIKVDPREKNGFNPEPKPVKPGKGKPPKRIPMPPVKPPITIQPVPKKPGRKSGRSR